MSIITIDAAEGRIVPCGSVLHELHLARPVANAVEQVGEAGGEAVLQPQAVLLGRDANCEGSARRVEGSQPARIQITAVDCRGKLAAQRLYGDLPDLRRAAPGCGIGGQVQGGMKGRQRVFRRIILVCGIIARRLGLGRRRGCQTGGDQEFPGQVGKRIGEELRARVDAALEIGESHPRRGAQRTAARVRLGNGSQQPAYIRVARGRTVQALAEEQRRGVQDAGDLLEVRGGWSAVGFPRKPRRDPRWLTWQDARGNITDNPKQGNGNRIRNLRGAAWRRRRDTTRV